MKTEHTFTPTCSSQGDRAHIDTHTHTLHIITLPFVCTNFLNCRRSFFCRTFNDPHRMSTSDFESYRRHLTSTIADLPFSEDLQDQLHDLVENFEKGDRSDKTILDVFEYDRQYG